MSPQAVELIRSTSPRALRAAALVWTAKASWKEGLDFLAGRASTPSIPVAGNVGSFVMGCAGLSTGRLPQSRSSRQSLALLDAALEGDCRSFDTAAAYGGGQSDRTLGAWMRSRRVRDDVTIIAKGGHPDARWRPRLDAIALRDDLHASLKRLRTDWVDYYLVHRDDPTMPVEHVVETLHTFVQEGKVGAIGASNWTYARIEEANRFATIHGYTPFTASSPHFSLAEMHEPPWPGCVSITGEAQAEARAWYARTGMLVLAWSPLAGGFFAGETPNERSLSSYCGGRNIDRRRRLMTLAQIRGQSWAQLALVYLLRQPMHVVPIVSASSPDRLLELLASRPSDLTAEEIEWLDLAADHPDGTGR